MSATRGQIQTIFPCSRKECNLRIRKLRRKFYKQYSASKQPGGSTIPRLTYLFVIRTIPMSFGLLRVTICKATTDGTRRKAWTYRERTDTIMPRTTILLHQNRLAGESAPQQCRDFSHQTQRLREDVEQSFRTPLKLRQFSSVPKFGGHPFVRRLPRF